MAIRDKLTVLGREPLCQFLALGFLLWGGLHYWNARGDRYTIQIGAAERARIAASYVLEFGQEPTAEQLQQLIDRYVREEIFWREGVALHLDQGDEIVRRRIVQKFEFLQTDLGEPDAPSPGVLENWFGRNQLRFLQPARVAFSQIYFSPDTGGDAGARTRALAVLEKVRSLRASRAPSLGDVFPGPADVGALTHEEAARVFGQSEFSEQLFKLPVGSWVGPLRSGYGWHLVYVTDRVPPVLPPLAQVHDQVLADYLDEQRRLLNSRNFETLRAKYTIVNQGARR